MALTRDQIWQVANELAAEAIKPTLSNVRKRLGSGSYTTIQEAMAEWKSRRQQASTPNREPAPAELTALTQENNQLKTELHELRAAQERLTAELADVKRKSGEEINRTMEKANRKDTEAIEARKGEKAAIERAARAEGKVEALQGQLADMTAALKSGRTTGGRS
jgi:chromosome segregation ATPase